jgi:osmotically-inducible protein OsmY
MLFLWLHEETTMLRPRDGEVSDMTTDTDLQERVLNQLQWERVIDATGVRVAVRDGFVTLAGQVESQEARVAIEWAAGRVSGVKGVESELVVVAPPARIIA